MSCFVSMWEESKVYELETLVELEAARAACLPKKGGWKKALAVVATLVCSAAPALAIAASNGYFEAPPEPIPEPTPVVNDMAVPEPEPVSFTVTETVVTAPAPKKVAYRGPKSCSKRTLDLYGGQVRVCARPASPVMAKDLSAKDLSSFWR